MKSESYGVSGENYASLVAVASHDQRDCYATKKHPKIRLFVLVLVHVIVPSGRQKAEGGRKPLKEP